MSDQVVAESHHAGKHADWPELFFDLIAVAGVAMLGHMLAGDFTPAGFGLFCLLFVAFWLTWTTFMLYGNSNDHPRFARLLVGMFGMGVMAASVPQLTESLLHPDGASTLYAGAFALAYVFSRFVAANSWRRGQVLTEFPVAQSLLGALPWLASLWVPLTWRPVLWAVGILVDLIVIVVRDGNRWLGKYEQRLETGRERAEQQAADGTLKVHRDRKGNERTVLDRIARIQIASVRLDSEHLDERLGLFVIIVLGEGVIQLVTGASEVNWGQGIWLPATLSFALLVFIFLTSLIYGHAGIAYLRERRLNLRLTLALHAISTASIVAIAIALEVLIVHPHSALPTQQLWLLCGGLASYFAVGLVADVASNGLDRGSVGFAVTGIVVPISLGVSGLDRSALWVLGYATALVGLQLWLSRKHRAMEAAGALGRQRKRSGQGRVQRKRA